MTQTWEIVTTGVPIVGRATHIDYKYFNFGFVFVFYILYDFILTIFKLFVSGIGVHL